MRKGRTRFLSSNLEPLVGLAARARRKTLGINTKVDLKGRLWDLLQRLWRERGVSKGASSLNAAKTRHFETRSHTRILRVLPTLYLMHNVYSIYKAKIYKYIPVFGSFAPFCSPVESPSERIHRLAAMTPLASISKKRKVTVSVGPGPQR
jgi:hypothetical protein